MANSARLHAVLDHIKTLPDAVKLNLSETSNYGEPMWDQRKWIAIPSNTMIEGSCGTAGCFAGWAVMLFAPKFELDLTTNKYDPHMVYNVILDGEEKSRSIEGLAIDLLDLNHTEADALFDYDNDLPTIERVISQIEAGDYPEDDDE